MVSINSSLKDQEKALKKVFSRLEKDEETPSREKGVLGKGFPPQRLLGYIGENAFVRAFKLETPWFYDFVTPQGKFGEIKVATFPRRKEGIYLKLYSYEVRKLQESKKEIFVLLWCPLTLHQEYLKLLLEGKKPPFSPIEFEVVGYIKKKEILKIIEGRSPWIKEEELTKVKNIEELLELLGK